MKIIVNGSLIDLDYVYEITEIVSEFEQFFEIHFLNDNVKKVKYKKDVIYSEEFHNFLEMSSEEKIKNKELRRVKRFESFQKITEMRNEIVKLWSENQSKFPTFNI
jgi:hypothetical protein